MNVRNVGNFNHDDTALSQIAETLHVLLRRSAVHRRGKYFETKPTEKNDTRTLWATNLFAGTVVCKSCFLKHVINEEVNC